MHRAVSLIALALAGPLIWTGGAQAQVVSPMAHDVTSISRIATAQFEVANPYDFSQVSEFFIVDARGRSIPGAQVSPARRQMAAGARAPLLVRVPVTDPVQTTVYVCHAITPRHPNRVASGTDYRGEVCALLTITRPQ